MQAAMYRPLIRAYRYLRGDGSLTLAVVVLIVFVFVLYPMVEVGVVARIWLDILFAAFLILGAVFVFEPRPIVWAFIAFMIVATVASLIEHFAHERWIIMLRIVVMLLASTTLGWLLLVRVMRDGRINLNRIMGAIGSYLLIGVVFSQAYRLLAAFVPEAFAIGGAPASDEQIHPRLFYYSFVTLTSLGYGDITPLHPYARSLATMEALAGNLFLTVLIARLVGMEMSAREAERLQEHDKTLAKVIKAEIAASHPVPGTPAMAKGRPA